MRRYKELSYYRFVEKVELDRPGHKVGDELAIHHHVHFCYHICAKSDQWDDEIALKMKIKSKPVAACIDQLRYSFSWLLYRVPH